MFALVRVSRRNGPGAGLSRRERCLVTRQSNPCYSRASGVVQRPESQAADGLAVGLKLRSEFAASKFFGDLSEVRAARGVLHGNGGRRKFFFRDGGNAGFGGANPALEMYQRLQYLGNDA